jgi:hypothetical protein
LWFQALRWDVPDNCYVWVHVRLVDGTTFWGALRGYSTEGRAEEREIAIEGVRLTQQDAPTAGDAPPARQVGEEWQAVLIHASQIRYLRVQYRDIDTNVVRPTARRAAAVARTSTGGVRPPQTGTSSGQERS